MALFNRSNSYDDRGGLTLSDEFSNMTYYAKITETKTTTSETGTIPNAMTWGDTTYKEWGHGAGASGKFATLKFDMFEKRHIKSWMFSYYATTNGNVDFDVEISNDDSTWVKVSTENLSSVGPQIWGDQVGGDHKARYIRFTAICQTNNGVNMAFSFIQVYV